MNVLLLQLDGKMPNIALMRIAAHHRAAGDAVDLRRATTARAVAPLLWERPGRIYASLIFERTRPVAEALRLYAPEAIIGGTGWDVALTLADVGISTKEQDYSIYPTERRSIGFLRRGCRLRCSFCVVPRKEGAIAEEQTVEQFWRGEPWPKELVLLDNDFFGGREWPRDIEAIRSGGFKVSFNQGINARMLNDETAAAIASVKYRDDGFTTKRLYTAWDSRGDERALFRGLKALVRHGVTPDDIMVYMLVGYWPGETHEDRDYRRARLREFGARPYPMPFVRTPELIGFQRWVIGAYDKRVAWREWEAARYRPERLGATA